MLRQPPGSPAWFAEVTAILNEESLRREPLILGWRDDGSNLHLRFRSALSTGWVQVHVQSTDADGGGPDYNPAQYVSSTLYECRATRLQDVVVPDLPSGWYTIYLVPVQFDAVGTKILFDGQSGRPDNMAFIGGVVVGAAMSLTGELAEEMREMTRESLRTNRAILELLANMNDEEAEDILDFVDTISPERSAT